MASNSGDSGCGCIILLIILCIIGGGFWQGIVLAGLGWLGILAFIGVSVGIFTWIVVAISGK